MVSICVYIDWEYIHICIHIYIYICIVFLNMYVFFDFIFLFSSGMQVIFSIFHISSIQHSLVEDFYRFPLVNIFVR